MDENLTEAHGATPATEPLALKSNEGLGLGPERAAFERCLASKFPGTMFDRDEFNDDRYRSLDVRMAWAAWSARSQHGGERRFAGYFSEMRSGMSYRLWEQGSHEPEGDDVALYEA